ncbi:MAG: hypothetical protein ABL921_04250 [Pirellula sp.]
MNELADRLLSGDRDYESMQAENWAKSHPEHIRTYREEEARNADDRKKSRRAERRREEAALARAGE